MKSKVIYIILLFAACLTLQAQTQEETQTPTTEKLLPSQEINIMIGESRTMGIIDVSPDNPNKSFGRFSFSYFYRIKNRWLSIGATSTYTPYGISTFSRTYNVTETGINSESKITTSYGSSLSLSAEIRFYPLSKECVNLYGGMALGYMADFSTNNAQPSYFRNLPYYQVTFIGVSVGKNFIWGTEIGIGCKGIINMYIGYKF